MFKNIFYFHSKERNTLFLLLVATLVYSYAEPLFRLWTKAEINRLEVVSLTYSRIGLNIADCHQANLLNLEDLRAFGMDSTLAQRWLNYRDRKGGFFAAEDFQNVWGLNTEHYQLLAAHLEFNKNPYPQNQRSLQRNSSGNPSRSVQQRTTRSQDRELSEPAKREVNNIAPFCINTVAAEKFQKIRGIGPVLSDRIVSYRERLGGFYSTDQLKEVFGLEEELIDNNRHLLLIENQSIKPLDWKEAEFRTLLAHPYLDYDQVVCIMNQKRAGAESASELGVCFTEEEWMKVKKYFVIKE